MSKEKLVKVYQAAGEMEAEVIKGLLETSGIPCLLKTVPSSPVNVYTGVSLAQVDVMVNENRAEEALQLIRSQADVDTSVDDDE